MSPTAGDGVATTRRRATPDELREGARQIAQAHVRLQLQATQIPVEDSPAAGLQEEPQGLPALEMLPEPRLPRSAAEVVEAQLRGQRPDERDGGMGKGRGRSR